MSQDQELELQAAMAWRELSERLADHALVRVGGRVRRRASISNAIAREKIRESLVVRVREPLRHYTRRA